MHWDYEKTLWTLVGTGAAVIAAALTRQALDQTWQWSTGDEAPRNPADSDVSWRQALLFTALTGAVMGVARMSARRGATSGWEAWTGYRPPGVG